MKSVLKKIWFPLAVVCFLALQTAAMDMHSPKAPWTSLLESIQDTIKYRNQFIKRGGGSVDDTAYLKAIQDTTPALSARDTIFPPDSLKDIDPFRYRYYVALLDSATHVFVRDSLKEAGDSLDWPKLDSLYAIDSTIRAKEAFDEWYASLSKTDRKKYDIQVKENIKKHIADSVLAIKDSIKAIKDSIREYTPRILETFALPDSMQYKRIIQWTHEREFHKMHLQFPDTGYNYRFYDYPIFRKDVNATWLGVAGSPVQYYDYFKRDNENGVAFYQPYEPWSFSPATLPMYNTKTPYTELAYFGTLFANSQKESDNLHIMTTQNILPELNFTLEYDRFGGNGMMENERTANKTFIASTNYLGKRYMMHVGYIYNKIVHNENGGISDNKMVTDTTLDAREYPVYLTSASSVTKKNTVFIDQQYRIPFTFLKKLKYRKEVRADEAYRDSITATGDSAEIASMEKLLAERKLAREARDTTGNMNITSAFIGHSSEYSVFTRMYQDEISSSDTDGRNLYRNNFLYNPTQSHDSSRVMKLENRIFIRLQPWSSEGIVSKLDVGAGNRLQNFYNFDYSSFLGLKKNTTWNSTFLYAGIEGQLKKFIQWDAKGDFVLVGPESQDFSVKANAKLNIFPFRRQRYSPVSFNAHFETSLKEPDYYWQRYYSNHYAWNNGFDKISTTKVTGSMSIPRWNISLDAGYALLKNNIYFDSTGIKQNTSPMSVLSASMTKNFNIFNFLHLDNRILFQVSSDEDVIPVPTVAINARYYIQFNVKRNIMQMQIGANAWYNTKFYAPGWNPAIGQFYNQKEAKYNNGPYIDAFVNVQWKRACIFIKVENVGQGWPASKNDYFSANHFIRTQRALKFGIYWPFYLQPSQNKKVSVSSGSMGGGRSSGGGSSSGGFGGIGGGLMNNSTSIGGGGGTEIY